MNKEINEFVNYENETMILKNKEILEENIKILSNRIHESILKIRDIFKDILVTYRPFFIKYGYDIKYLNKVIYLSKYAKKKRVRNKYRNMIKSTLGEDNLNKILEV